jgi:DNA repair photolyase
MPVLLRQLISPNGRSVPVSLGLEQAQFATSSAPRISVREVRCATLLHSLNYRSSTGYTANLYKGCTHGCVYCYAPSLTHDERIWGTYVDVKVNAPLVLERELRGLRKEEVFLSSASDPYQPVEARYRLTRRCLEVLHRHRFPVSILTRSPLVLRDLDLLKKLGSVRVGMSITTVPVREFEPGVPPLERRVDTLRRLRKAGIRTWVSLAPVIPGIVMLDLERLFRDLSEAGVSWVSFGVLRFAGYEESRRMFEEATGMSTAEALAGRDELVARLSELVRRYSMEPKDDASEWKPEPDFHPLDSFGAAGGINNQDIL